MYWVNQMHLLPFKSLVDIHQPVPKRWYKHAIFVIKKPQLLGVDTPPANLPVYCYGDLEDLVYDYPPNTLGRTSSKLNQLYVPRFIGGLVAVGRRLLFVNRVGTISYSKGLPMEQLVGTLFEYNRNRIRCESWSATKPHHRTPGVEAILNMLDFQLNEHKRRDQPIVVVPGQAVVLTSHIGLLPRTSVWLYHIMYNDIIIGHVDLRDLPTATLLPEFNLLKEHVNVCLARLVVSPFE